MFKELDVVLTTVPLSSGPQIVMNVESGNDRHRFRTFHQAMALLKYLSIPDHEELYTLLEVVCHLHPFLHHLT